jgi:hypothetical protein
VGSFVQALLDDPAAPRAAFDAAIARGSQEVLGSLFKREIANGLDRRAAFIKAD